MIEGQIKCSLISSEVDGIRINKSGKEHSSDCSLTRINSLHKSEILHSAISSLTRKIMCFRLRTCTSQ